MIWFKFHRLNRLLDHSCCSLTTMTTHYIIWRHYDLKCQVNVVSCWIHNILDIIMKDHSRHYSSLNSSWWTTGVQEIWRRVPSSLHGAWRSAFKPKICQLHCVRGIFWELMAESESDMYLMVIIWMIIMMLDVIMVKNGEINGGCRN